MWRSDFQLKKHWKTFIAKRLIRIEPSYFASILFTVLVGYFVNFIYGRDIYSYSIPQLLSHFFYLNSFFGYEWVNPVYWTLAIEFQFYLGLILVYQALHRICYRWSIFFISIACSVFLPSSSFIFKFLPFFLMGISAFLYYSENIKKSELFFLLLISLAANIFSTGAITAAMVGLITALIILFVRLPDSKFFIFIGNFSYSIYLFHYPLVEKIVRAGKVFGYSLISQLFVLTLSLAISVAISYLMYLWIERPAMLRASKMRYQEVSFS